MNSKLFERQETSPSRTLEDVLAYAQMLFTEWHDPANEEQVIDIVRAQLPERTRALFDEHRSAQMEKLNSEDSPSEEAKHKVASELLRTLDRLLEEHYEDPTLKTEGYPIFSKPHGLSLFRRRVRESIQEKPTVDIFHRIGVAFFDGNGIKSVNACVGYDEVSRYLTLVAKIFADTQGPTRLRFEKEGIQMTPMSVGGDEFAVLLTSQTPIARETMAEIVSSYQEEIASSEELRQFLHFEDRNVLINYGYPKKDRDTFDVLGVDAQEQKLREIRMSLPDTFSPSFSGAGVTLDEVIEQELVMMNEKGETFDTFRDKMFGSLMRIAEMRQGENKEALKENLLRTDPKSHQFLLRTANERQLQEEIDALRRRVGLLMEGSAAEMVK